MTSVRGAVNKVSYSIAGFVHAHDYNVVERHSRNQENGDITTKRIKLDSDNESNNPAAHQESHQVAVVSSWHKANLVWIDESTRVAHWHQIAVLVRALKDLSKSIQKSEGRNETGLPGPRPDDERRSPRLYHLRVHLGTFQQTAAILESIYSHTFLARLKEKFTFPQTTMDYETSPGEHLAIASAKVFLDNPPKECFSALSEAGVTPRVIEGVSADLGAIASQMPMPGLVQRAGFVGKVIKFFRGLDSFGCDASDDVVDTKMPGSFPDTQPKSGPAEEEASNARVESEERIRKKKETSRSYTPVAQTDTYSYIKDHLAEMETKVESSYRDKSSEKGSQGAPPKPISTIATRKDGQLSPALKRLQKSRYMKRVHFSPSTKQPSPSPMRPAGFLSKIFRSRGEIAVGSSLRHFGSERPLGDAQTDGSLDSRNSKDPDQELGSECQADDASGDGSDVDVIDKCKTRLVRHLNEFLKEREASRSSDRGEPPAPIGSPLGLPELDGLRISDDKEGELDDLSAALQLMLDEGEARQREEEARKAKEAEQERLRKTGGLRIPRKRLVKSLPSNWIARVQSTTRAPPNQVLAQTAESVDLRRHDFLKVVPPTEWLNDEIVNGSLQWLDRYVNEAAGASEVRSTKRVCLAMNSFFYKRLEDSGVHNTERALRRFGVSKTNFLNLETILMPICKNNHWTLLVVRPQKRTVSHMDSLNPGGSAVHTKRALDWIKALLGDDFKTTEWQTVQHQAPVQDNGYDCGVFTITNGMCLALGLNAADAYSNEELPLQRLRIAGMLLNKGFSGEFDLAGL
ncbi:ulp1 protease family protein [Colletotrichum musicola]|uniref:Ulp1 protease family protein n=1 Tax=Colletotrichum musicola TaxID=2175873 RepID=A0A8H6N0N3_9PEZI|nr:ulp1 protease family protein [Colletotrichum musicola]